MPTCFQCLRGWNVNNSKRLDKSQPPPPQKKNNIISWKMIHCTFGWVWVGTFSSGSLLCVGCSFSFLKGFSFFFSFFYFISEWTNFSVFQYYVWQGKGSCALTITFIFCSDSSNFFGDICSKFSPPPLLCLVFSPHDCSFTYFLDIYVFVNIYFICQLGL